MKEASLCYSFRRIDNRQGLRGTAGKAILNTGTLPIRGIADVFAMKRAMPYAANCDRSLPILGLSYTLSVLTYDIPGDGVGLMARTLALSKTGVVFLCDTLQHRNPDVSKMAATEPQLERREIILNGGTKVGRTEMVVCGWRWVGVGDMGLPVCIKNPRTARMLWGLGARSCTGPLWAGQTTKINGASHLGGLGRTPH